MPEIISAEQAAQLITDNSSVMFGGFMGCGGSREVIDALVHAGRKNLTMICNDTSTPGLGVAKLIENKLVSKLIASHVGLLPETGRQISAKEIEYELIPQGTLAERIRSAGAGLGGFYTPTGVGTVVAEGKEVKNIGGYEYLLEIPLFADFAVVRANTADKSGNLRYRRSARNFNPLMATAAKVVIAEVEELVEVGELDPDDVMTPGLFVDYLIKVEK